MELEDKNVVAKLVKLYSLFQAEEFSTLMVLLCVITDPLLETLTVKVLDRLN